MSFHFVCFPAFLSFLSISYIFDVSYISHISPPKKNYISLPDVHKNWLIRLQVWMPDLRRCWCAKSAISKSFYDQLRSSLSLCTLLKFIPSDPFWCSIVMAWEFNFYLLLMGSEGSSGYEFYEYVLAIIRRCLLGIFAWALANV